MALRDECYKATCSVLAEEREKQVEGFANREKGNKKRALILLCPGMQVLSHSALVRPSLELLHQKFQSLLQHGTSSEKQSQNTETCPMSIIKEVDSHKSNPLLGSVLCSLSQAFWGPFNLHSNPEKWLGQNTQFTKKLIQILSCSRIKSQTDKRAELGLQLIGVHGQWVLFLFKMSLMSFTQGKTLYVLGEYSASEVVEHFSLCTLQLYKCYHCLNTFSARKTLEQVSYVGCINCFNPHLSYTTVSSRNV